MLHQRKILVTGGAGYIGSHACKALAQAGYLPIAYDNLSTGHAWSVKWGPLITGDLGDKDLLVRIMREYDIKAVIHFAAHAYVGESMTAPEKYFHNNVTKTFTLLEAMRETGVQHIVFSSTCATYGIPQEMPISESQPQNPVNPYGESKLFVERTLKWHDVAHQLRSVSLRYFNAAGADAEGDIGENHDPETHLIPLVIQAAMGERSHIGIFGTDYPSPDGTAIRDYIHVTDLAAAHVQALDYLLRGGKTLALNLGTGSGHSVRKVIATVEHVGGMKVPVRESPRRAGDPPILVANAALANRTLHWKPRQSSLETIIETAWDWHTRTHRTVRVMPAAVAAMCA